MKEQEKFYRSIIGIAIVTVLILMVPLVAMQFSDEIDWKVGDFIVVGALVFGTGLSYKLLTRNAPNITYRAAISLALGTALFMVWANLAVGLIGSGPHPGNLMYAGVLFVVVCGIILSRFRAGGMERAMYAATIALALHAVIALLAGMHHYPGSSVTEILSVNAFFAGLFFISGLLFRNAAKETTQEQAKTSGQQRT